MAQKGQPFIGTWSYANTTYRLFEDSASGYVQVATAGFAHQSTVNPVVLKNLQTPSGENFIVVQNRPLNGSWHTQLIDVNGVIPSLDFVNSPVSAYDLLIATAVWPNAKLIVSIGAGTGAGNALIYNETTNVFVRPATPIINYSVAANAFEVHPSEMCVFVGAAAGASGHRLLQQSSVTVEADSVNIPHYLNSQTITDLQNGCIAAKWSPDGSYLFASDATGVVFAFQYDAVHNTIGLGQSIAEAYGAAQLGALSVSPNGRYVIVGFYNGTTFTTVVYRRLGYTLRKMQVLTGIGGELFFSPDGKYILDPALKVSYAFDAPSSTFIPDASNQLNNINTGAASFVITNNAVDQVAYGSVYLEGARQIADRLLDTANLKVVLLNHDAVYNNGDTVASTVIGAHEVYGQGWPQGGLALTTVAYGDNTTGNASLKADDVKQILIEPITFRYAMIYDATSAKPLVWLDFGSDYTTERETTLVFNLSDFGVAEFLV